MNKKAAVLAVLILLLLVPAADAWSWNPATWISRAFKIGDAKDIDLNSQAIGNGNAWNLTCQGNCSGYGITSTETNANNLTSGNVSRPTNITITNPLDRVVDAWYSGMKILALVDGYGCQATYCIYSPWYSPSQIYAKNGSTGIIDYSGSNPGAVYASIWSANPSGNYSVKFACGTYTSNTSYDFRNYTEFSGSGDCTVFIVSGNNNVIGEEISRPIKYYNVKIHDFRVDGNKSKNSAPASDAFGNGIRVNYFDNVDVYNIEVFNTNNNGITLYQCSNCSVRNNRIHDTGNLTPSGSYSLNGIIEEFNSNDNVFEGNQIWTTGQTGITIIAGGANNERNRISKNDIRKTAGDCINIREQNLKNGNFTISENILAFCGDRGIKFDPITATGNNTGMLVLNNQITSPVSHGIDFNSLSVTNFNAVIGNYVKDSGGIGISFSGTTNNSFIGANFVLNSTTADIRNNGNGNNVTGNFFKTS